MSVADFFNILPRTHTAGPFDYNLGFFNVYLTALVLVTPYTPGWKLFRAAIAAPVIAGIWLYLILTPMSPNDTDQWGIPILMFTQVFRTLEWFVFFPAEENCHRIVPKSTVYANNLTIDAASSSNSDTPSDGEALVAEPIPPAFTLAKFWWGCSLWWSWRGIGWNVCCPLSPSARQHPYTRNSSRSSFFWTQLQASVIALLIGDLARTYTNLSSAAPFFAGRPGIAPLYASLTTGQRAVYSTVVVMRVWQGLVRWHLGASLICVAIGGYMGWEGVLWSPWGWPPLFGSLQDLWRHPGLSTMWSRTWQGYNRRWLYIFGWIGIGENILGLTHTGISAHPRSSIQPSSTNTSSRNSPNPSGHVSPSHPLPSGVPSQLPTRKLSPRLMVQNLIKSFIVFTLSGLQHDVSTLMMLVKHPPGKILTIRDLIVYTPFFAIQPVALALEAGVKSAWRGWKARRHPEWKRDKKGEPAWLVFVERAVGFAWTWVWLGWTARWFVEGTAQSGKFRRDGDNPLFPSLFGGLYAGKWFH